MNELSNDPRVRLSALWIFIMLNFFARDIHELARPGMLEQVMSGTVNGVKVTELLMLVGGIMFEVPILMTVLVLFISRRANRLVNILACLFTTATIINTNLDPDLDNVFFLSIQLIALIIIARIAWRWPAKAS